ncbi:MAG: TIR domain-containing protein [Bacteroidales bacterium]|nr:TIR domain-containing protein [Bacteroidales bacterium]
MYDKIFISYAKEDFAYAEKLYNYLEENDFKPWIDKKGILPGQNWDFVIKKALREANYIILLLSDTSVQKRGYVQREFKTALDYVEEKLEDDIYIIPLKINNCEIPEKLSRFQWIEYEPLTSFELILRSLNLQREKYIEYERKQIAAKETFAYEEYNNEYEYGNSTKFVIQTKHIQFKDESNTNLLELNSIIRGKQAEFVTNSRKDFHEITGELIAFEYESQDWIYEISYTPNFISKSIISINENFYAYTGGAHGNGFINALNYHLNPLFKISLEDLFDYDDHKAVLDFISKYCYEDLRKNYNEWFTPNEEELQNQTPDTLFWEGSLNPEWEKFNTFFITKNGIEIIFNTYSVSSYAFGVQTVAISNDKLLACLTKPEIFLSFMNKVQ